MVLSLEHILLLALVLWALRNQRFSLLFQSIKKTIRNFKEETQGIHYPEYKILKESEKTSEAHHEQKSND